MFPHQRALHCRNYLLQMVQQIFSAVQRPLVGGTFTGGSRMRQPCPWVSRLPQNCSLTRTHTCRSSSSLEQEPTSLHSVWVGKLNSELEEMTNPSNLLITFLLSNPLVSTRYPPRLYTLIALQQETPPHKQQI